MSYKGQLTLSNKVGRTCILQRKILANRHGVSNSESDLRILFALDYREHPHLVTQWLFHCLYSFWTFGLCLLFPTFVSQPGFWVLYIKSAKELPC
jgi:hypothetical protein